MSREKGNPTEAVPEIPRAAVIAKEIPLTGDSCPCASTEAVNCIGSKLCKRWSQTPDEIAMMEGVETNVVREREKEREQLPAVGDLNSPLARDVETLLESPEPAGHAMLDIEPITPIEVSESLPTQSNHSRGGAGGCQWDHERPPSNTLPPITKASSRDLRPLPVNDVLAIHVVAVERAVLVEDGGRNRIEGPSRMNRC